MADNKSEEEPSIEEILSSIRQIISDDEEDEDEESIDDVQESIVESPIHEDSDDILELTEQDLVDDEPEEEPEIFEDPPIEIDMRDKEEDLPQEEIEEVIEEEPEPAQEPEAEHSDFEDDEPYEEPEEEEFMDQEDPRNIIEEIRAQTAQGANTVPSDILSNAAQSAALGSINKLKSKMPVNNARSYDGVTLEDIVREMLHPMLREWMDDNLPPMVERIVQKELEKLARRAFDD